MLRATSSPSPEYGLILDAVAPLPVPRAQARDIEPSRWQRVLQIAGWHRLAPLLYAHLRSEPAVPSSVAEALEQAYLANAARNLFVADARTRVLAALAAADVPAVLLKGAALLETAYPDPAVRELLDLDILVPAEKMSTATFALAGLGYLSTAEDGGTDAAPTHHAPALIGEEELVAVELHRHIATASESTSFPIEEVWQRARPSHAGSHRLPSPEDLLLHVSFHFTRNRLGGSYQTRNTGGALAQIADIARILHQQTIDWDALVSGARRYRLDAAVFLALFAARELGVLIPDGALATLRPARFEPSLGRRLVALRVLSSDEHLPVRSTRWMLLPSREVLRRGWAADPVSPRSLAQAYVRRARAHAPMVKTALRQPWMIVQDRRLGDQIRALQEHA